MHIRAPVPTGGRQVRRMSVERSAEHSPADASVSTMRGSILSARTADTLGLDELTRSPSTCAGSLGRPSSDVTNSGRVSRRGPAIAGVFRRGRPAEPRPAKPRGQAVSMVPGPDDSDAAMRGGQARRDWRRLIGPCPAPRGGEYEAGGLRAAAGPVEVVPDRPVAAGESEHLRSFEAGTFRTRVVGSSEGVLQ